MTREQFMALAGQLYDAQNGSAPRGNGNPPKYDTAIPAGQGVVIYASECSAKEIQYQITRAEKPPQPGKEQYAEKNQRRVKALGYWLSYRQSNPTDVWTGERNRRTVTAAPPSDRPAKHDREPYDAGPSNDEPATAATGGGDMDDVPFAPIGDVG